MTLSYKIVNLETPDDNAWTVIGHGLHLFNMQKGGEDHHQPVFFGVLDAEEELVGGVIGETHWEWLYINLMFLPEDLRGQGYGQRLLTLAEEEARVRGAKHAYLDTFSFQAPGFYEKLGYEVFGVLEDFPPGQKRFYYKKNL